MKLTSITLADLISKLKICHIAMLWRKSSFDRILSQFVAEGTNCWYGEPDLEDLRMTIRLFREQIEYYISGWWRAFFYWPMGMHTFFLIL